MWVFLVTWNCSRKASQSVSQTCVAFRPLAVATALHCERPCARENVSVRDMPVSEVIKPGGSRLSTGGAQVVEVWKSGPVKLKNLKLASAAVVEQ